MISIQSERLQLIALNHSDLVLWKNKGREALELSLGLTPNNLELEEFYRNETSKALHDFWIPQTRKFPFDFCWYTNWEIILKSTSCSVGGIGFSGLPDNEGSTEIGYVIDHKFRGKGIATEAIDLLISWATQDKDLLKVKAETMQGNLASQRVLQKNNFLLLKEHTIFIEKDIPTYIWEKVIQ